MFRVNLQQANSSVPKTSRSSKTKPYALPFVSGMVITSTPGSVTLMARNVKACIACIYPDYRIPEGKAEAEVEVDAEAEVEPEDDASDAEQESNSTTDAYSTEVPEFDADEGQPD